MLKSLEMFGFKSFADRTRFDFSRGITCVVGPNGSGKSNVVDAIKWILGDQSPKSLRGKEMTDVIFNGAAGRKPSAFAEATLTFDNSTGRLPIDTQEVQVGRRIWRNGDAEYLINRAPARLKDIRELFMGTGAATSAYSIIEQGRVDQILQANASARRLVFEEAAGISRYKSRKTDALRKLERVAQNLLRLTDIVDEVEAQLNATRSQAAKAAKYRTVSTELRELWLGLAADDHRHFSAKLQEIEEHSSGFESQIEELNGQQQEYEKRLSEFEVEISEVDDRLRKVERQSAAVRESVASHQATIRHQAARQRELESELVRLRKQRTTMAARTIQIHGELIQTRNQVDQFEQEYSTQHADAALRQQNIDEMTATVTERRDVIEGERQRLLALMRQMSMSNNRLAGLESQLDLAQAAVRKADDRGAALDVEIEGCHDEHHRHQQLVDEARAELQAVETQMESMLENQRLLQGEYDEFQRRLSQQREERSAGEARKTVLEDLERRQEGLGIGVKEILSRARTSHYSPWNHILGSVADLIEVDLDDAALLEVALGSRAQLVVIDDFAPLFEYLQMGVGTVSGRVGFISVDGETWPPAANAIPNEPLQQLPDLSDQANVVNRVDRLMRVTGDFPELPERLLGDTWLVTSLEAALALAGDVGRGCRFLTLQGELLEPDGTFYVGTLRGETALVSRKSELRRLKNDLLRLERRIREEEQQLTDLNDSLIHVDEELATVDRQKKAAGEVLAERVSDAAIYQRELERLRKEREGIQQEQARADQHVQHLRSEVEAAQAELTQCEEEADSLQSEIHDLERRNSEVEHELQRLKQQQTEAKLELAKQEERLTGLRSALKRLEEESKLRTLQREEAERRFEVSFQSRRETIIQILNASALLAELALDEEQLAESIAGMLNEKSDLRRQKSRFVEEENRIRKKRRELSDQKHNAEIEARDIRHQIATFGERIEEEYQITLEEVVESGVSAFQQYLRDKHGIEIAPHNGTPTAESDSQNDTDAHNNAAGDTDADGSTDTGPSGDAEQPTDVVEVGEDTTDVEGQTSDSDGPTSPSVEMPEIHFEDVRAEIEAQVNRLRRKLKLMGSVNTDSLDNLDELDRRYTHLSHQLQDLVEAKTTLEEIVRKINVESKRLFVESFEAIRVHFQELFRKLFGGGEGDVILENMDDVLECGIDIVARPPGKELRSITLLSGGEKTMTAVALLMAIFKSCPSPFCILDEVDAALDEANVERYSGVVKEFEETTQFIMITHSKRSMTVADILYGVTMEQSGVSKRMSVRFDDVSENGDIRPSAGVQTDDGSLPESEAA